MKQRLTVRRARPDDLAAYLAIQRESWGDELAVNAKRAQQRFDTCLDMIVAATYDHRAIGFSTQIRLASYDADAPQSWYDTTGDGWCTTHVPDGPVCFGVDMSVAQDHPRGAVDAIAAGSMGLVIELGIKYYFLGGRMPLYHRYASEYSADDYLRRRDGSGRHLDPQIGMYSRMPGVRVLGTIPNYFEDPDSLNYGVLLRWRNPFFGLPGGRRLSRAPELAYRQWQRCDDWLTRRKGEAVGQ